MPVSKIAVQVGLGVTGIGGVAGATAYYFLVGGVAEYLVEVTSDANSTAATDITNDIKEKAENQEKNYFCQWKKTSNNDESDNSCEIKQIKFDGTKKSALLSEIIKKQDNEGSFVTPITKENIKKANTWFLLKITGYSFNSATTDTKVIDILSTDKKTGSETEFKKYSTVMPKFKIENEHATQGKASTFLVKLDKKANDQITGNSFKCAWIFKTESDKYEGGISWTSHTVVGTQDCKIYKFTTQPTTTGTDLDKKVSELNVADINETEITTSVSTDIKDATGNPYFIINFTATAGTGDKSVLDLSDLVAIIEETASAGSTTKKPIAIFTVEAPLAGKVETTITSSNFILLN